MTRKLKNVTVTLEPEVARWARVEAAKRETSVSRLLGQLLEREMNQQEAYDAAMERFFAQRAGEHRKEGQPLPTRDELHDRESLR